MKKLILSISLMITSVSFSQDAATTFNFLIDCAGSGDKQSAITYFESKVTPLVLLSNNEYSNNYNWGTTECRISNDGIMIILPNKERFDEMKEFLNDVMGVPQVSDDKESKIKSYMYDYIQIADTHLNKDFVDGGVKYYIFSVYLEKKTE